MKKTLRTLYGALMAIAVLLISTSAKSQQSLIQVNGCNAYVHLPNDYTKTKVYPTIIEFPGLGEVGTNPSLVIEYGPGAYIAQGWDGNVWNGVDSVEFIVISLQPPSSYPGVAFNNTCIDSLKILYKIDPNNLFLTGYSEGGWCASMFVSSDPIGGPYTYASQVKAICTVEGVIPSDNSDYPYGFSGFAKLGGKDLCLEQVNDDRDGQAVVAEMDSTVANSAYFYQTDFDGGGHCCWSNFYGGGGTAPGVFPVFGTNETIYQWFASLVTTTTSTVPVISSATTATGTINTAFSYTITASNNPTSYAATGLPTGLSIKASTGVISGTPTVSGTFSVTISATNSSGTGSATLSLTINPPAPVVSSAATATGTVGAAFTYTITASNSPTSYNATGLPTGLSVNTSTGVISGTPTIVGTSTVTLSAINATGTGTKTLTITINPAAPVITSAATATGTKGTAFSYTITASNTPTSYNATGLPSGLSVNTSTGVISGTPTAIGTSTVTLSAINATGTGKLTLTISINPPAPVISSAATATGTVGTAFTYTITASNTPTSYNATGLPSGLSINTSTGVISGTPTAAGTSSVTISAINAGGTGTKTLTITINPAVPVVTSAATATGTKGSAFSYTITASNSPTSYSATGLPAGLSVNTSTGVISGTPTATGTTNVTISAINVTGTGTKTLTITINAASPVISSATTATGTVGTAFSYTITASNSPTSYGASGLPSGLSINTSTGVISGTPTAAGTFSITLSAINATGTGTQTLTITINPAVPVITSAGTATGTVGIAFSYAITATNTPTGYGATGLPAGLSVNTSTGVISEVPTTAGTYSVTISATNAGGTGTKVLTIIINPAAPVITSVATASGTVGVAFNYTITASNTPASYGATGLPSGLSINTSTGVISGTPTTAGTFSIILSAINTGGTGTETLTLTISSTAPVISSAATASGTISTKFSYTITASNSPTSYGATGLPKGLSVKASTGVISGTPTAAGVTVVTISATNASGTGTKSLTITINPPTPVISSAATATGTNGTAFSYTITASNTPTSYGATGLPAGLSVNASTGVISGTPTTAGTYSVTISATNGTGTGTLTLTITINLAAPVITSATSATGTTGTLFSYTITASNSPTSYGATGLPSGLSINTSTGVISGTPTVGGTYSVTISAKNAGGTATATLVITINSVPECSGPVIVNTKTPPALNGTVDTNWAKAPTNAITKTVNDTLRPDYSAQWRAMYDSTYLYVLVEVKDVVLEAPPYGPNPYDDDAVEIYIDANNTKTTSYGSTDFQFGFDWGVAATTANMYGSTTRTGIVYAIPAVTGGYNLAVKIPWSTIGGTPPVNGKLIGFDININDNDGGNADKTRQATSGWYSSSNQEFTNPSLFGTAALTVCKGIALPPVPVITSADTATGLTGFAFSYAIIASDTPTSYTTTGLPAGLILDVPTGTIIGTPTSVGTSTVTITATNEGGTTTKNITIIINQGPTPGLVTCYKTPGTITVDGSLSESGWNIINPISKVVLGSYSNTATFGVLWDKTNLYIGAKVLDANLYSPSSTTLYNDDAIEVYVDPSYSRSTTYIGDDNQIIEAYDQSGVYTQLAITGLQHAWTAIPGGYSVEIAIPWSQLGITSPAAGLNIGFDMANDDDDNGSGRTGQAVWNGTLYDYDNTSAFGTLTLSGTTSTGSRPELENTATPLANANVVLMPNPVTTGVLKALVPGWQGDVQVEIRDFEGMLIQTQTINVNSDSKIDVDVSKLKSGVYILQLKNSSGVSTQKFLVE